VDSIGIASARVIALSQGGGEIVATVGSGEFQTAEHRAAMLVLPLAVNPATDWPDTLTVTDTVVIAANVSGAGADPRASVVRWSSSNPSAFTVTALPNGSARVVAFRQGGGEIVATVGEAPFQVTERRQVVRVEPLTVVAFAWPATMNVTNDSLLRVVVSDAHGNMKQSLPVQWRSTNESAFSVSASGRVTAIGRGSGEIVAAVGSAPFETTERRASIRVLQKWRTIDAGWSHTCATTSPDRVAHCWGSNRFGELGIGADPNLTASTPRRVATALRFEQLEAGGDSLYPTSVTTQPQAHTCGRDASMLTCWGASANGQIGDIAGACSPLVFFDIACTRSLPVGVIVNGVFASNSAVRVLGVVAGGRVTCAILIIGANTDYATCWGLAGSPPVTVSFGTQPGDDSEALSSVLDNAGALAGGAHVCVSTGTTRSIRCLGSNEFGQAGDAIDNFVRDGFGGMLVFPKGAGLGGSGPVASGGGNHSCVIQSAFPAAPGTVYCWGSNSSGQLGAGSSETCSGVPCSHTALAVMLPTFASHVSAGNNHTCAIANGDAYCWGSNEHGQLGNGAVGGSSPAPVLVGGGIKFTRISAGSGFTCALAVDGSPYCWGRNDVGQLGDGTTTSRALPVRIGEPDS
jgi:alpha-tubulin suppressor-like RCC1 family protein